MEQVIPGDVQQFILDRIDSIAQLEALVILRNTPDSWWPSAAIAERLYITESTCRAEMDGLTRQQLLLDREEGGARAYRYRPSTGDLREMVDRLVYYYSKHLVPISNLVHSKPRTRINEFARAFTITKQE